MKVIVEVLVEKYRKGSIIKNIDDNDGTFYLPEKKESFKSYNYESKMKSLKDSSFEYLGHTDDEILSLEAYHQGQYEKELRERGSNNQTKKGDNFYLCREEIVLFKIMNIVHLGTSNHIIDNDDSLIHDISFPCVAVLDDIENDIKENDKKGHLTKVISCLFQEDWHQCYEGDWDGNLFYIGVLNGNGHLYPSSKERIKKYKEDINNYWTNWGEEYEPSY